MAQPFDWLSFAACNEIPERLTAIESWHRHIPFAFAVLAMARPRVLVELGTHRGDSYCAFCQGIASQGLATRCFAVDTWQGDIHSGLYDDDVYADLSAFHDPRYSGFSTLLRMTFDQALPLFADGGIDLLHIDGLHTYDAVRHDFESWLPKLSDRAVVLLHDTNVQRDGFAVWRLWGELRARYRGFEFPYGSGLGVSLVGPNAPARLAQFISIANDEPEHVTGFFHSMGDGAALRKSSNDLALARARVESLGAQLSHARSVVELRDRQLQELNAVREHLEQKMTAIHELLHQEQVRPLQEVPNPDERP